MSKQLSSWQLLDANVCSQACMRDWVHSFQYYTVKMQSTSYNAVQLSHAHIN